MPNGKIVRLYQGRVEAVEADPPATLETLWDHHKLFQDAVNYYLVALAALAAPGGDSPMSQLRGRVASAWLPFARGARRYQGLRDSLRPFLSGGACEGDIDGAFAAVLAGNPTSPAILAAAVDALAGKLKGASAVQQRGKDRWPMFCDPAFSGTFPGDKRKLDREAAKQWLPCFLHDAATTAATARARLELHLFANIAQGHPPYEGERARQRLKDAVAAFRGQADGPSLDRCERAIAGAEPEFPAYRAGGAGPEVRLARLNAFLLLKYVEASDFTLRLLRDRYPVPRRDANPAPAPGEPPPSAQNSIRRARGDRGYVFPAFTSLPAWGGDGGGPRWKEFDIAAFKEALTTVNQVQQKTTERKERADKIQEALDWMEAKAGARPPRVDAEDEGEEPQIHRLDGDPRWPLVKKLLAEELADEQYLAEGEVIPYGLRRGTLRGFAELREKWRQVVRAGQAPTPEAEAKLLDITAQFQTAKRNGVGSVNLFRALTQAKYWPLWQEPTAAEARERAGHGFAADILSAHRQYLECQAEAERLREPITFTPADAEYSRRQFRFSDLSGRSKSKHLSGAISGRFGVEVSLARQDAAGHWAKSRAILRYTAPRLLRDRLRCTGHEDLEHAAWLAPMVAAFNPPEPAAQNLAKAPVGLLPDRPNGNLRVLLNFPLKLQPDSLLFRCDSFDWEPQFAAFGTRGQKQRFYLRWPPQATDQQNRAVPWWQSRQEFTCLAVDLGQRDAGGFAVLRARAEPPATAGRGPERLIGDDGDKKWFASLAACGLMRLPGEDAKVWRGEQWAQEYSGEKGRMPESGETTAAEEIVRDLGEGSGDWFGETAARLSFPEQNTVLLRAFGRTQWELARCHRWLWMLRDEQKRPRALGEIRELDASGPRADWRGWAQSDERARIEDALGKEIERLSQLLPSKLEAIADRCLPLRGRRWAWQSRTDRESAGARRHQLAPVGDAPCRPRLAGQRGLSMERIEQIGRLRRCCQSLNKALQREPGAAPPIAKDLRAHPLPEPCPEILAKLDRMKRQRVNQTAHWILAEALGVRPRPHAAPPAERAARDQHAEYERVPGREPVDFIVLEDLSRYRTSQDRPRRENGRLMQWCHRQILAKVMELAEPFGICVLETAPAYSSRFCSRTGAAGFRAVDLTTAAMDQWPWREALGDPGADHHQEIAVLLAWLRAANAGRGSKKPRCLLAPDRGGPLFVSLADRRRDAKGSADGQPPPYWVMQADINAAINLGLRAIAAPDAADIHLRIPTEVKEGQISARARSEREKARWRGGPTKIEPAGREDFAALLKDSRQPNFFVDMAGLAEFDRARIEGMATPVASGRGLWTRVRQREWEVCREINEWRMQRWRVPVPQACATAT